MWTISGWSAGRPLTSKIRRTAAALAASAPRPYTVSVGMATSPPARSTSTRERRRLTDGTASRNSSAASMKPNDSGVAKWSVRFSVPQRRVGQRRGERFARPGEVVVADDDQRRARSRGQLGVGVLARRGRRITAASATGSLPGCVGVLGEHRDRRCPTSSPVPSTRGDDPSSCPLRRARTRCAPMPASTSRRNRCGSSGSPGAATSWRRARSRSRRPARRAAPRRSARSRSA